MRSMTTPARLPSSHIRPFLSSYSTNRLEFKATGQRLDYMRKQAVDRNGCEMELYLMRNAIRMLPRELFALDCLVVLSLRAFVSGAQLPCVAHQLLLLTVSRSE